MWKREPNNNRSKPAVKAPQPSIISSAGELRTGGEREHPFCVKSSAAFWKPIYFTYTRSRFPSTPVANTSTYCWYKKRGNGEGEWELAKKSRAVRNNNPPHARLPTVGERSNRSKEFKNMSKTSRNVCIWNLFFRSFAFCAGNNKRPRTVPASQNGRPVFLFAFCMLAQFVNPSAEFCEPCSEEGKEGCPGVVEVVPNLKCLHQYRHTHSEIQTPTHTKLLSLFSSSHSSGAISRFGKIGFPFFGYPFMQKAKGTHSGEG